MRQEIILCALESRLNGSPTRNQTLASCERSHSCCHLSNNFGSHRIFPILPIGPEHPPKLRTTADSSSSSSSQLGDGIRTGCALAVTTEPHQSPVNEAYQLITGDSTRGAIVLRCGICQSSHSFVRTDSRRSYVFQGKWGIR